MPGYRVTTNDKELKRFQTSFQPGIEHITNPQKNAPTSNMLARIKKKTGSFSLIERVILSAGAMLIFSVSFQIDQMPEGIRQRIIMAYMGASGKGWVRERKR